MNKRQQDRLARLLPGGVPRYVRVYDNGGDTADRYLVVFAGHNPRWEHEYMPGWGSFSYPVLSMSGNPTYPQGVGQHSSYPYMIDRPTYGHLGRKIRFQDLPKPCQNMALRDYLDYWDLPTPEDVVLGGLRRDWTADGA